MGGYLPLELGNGEGFFKNIEETNILELNTGRAAIWCAVMSLDVKMVMVPYFYCPDIIQMLQTMDIEIIFYHIGEDLMPANINIDNKNFAIILVNYYGIIGREVVNYSKKFKKVILDQAHAFFHPPVMEDGVMNVYSCRKFFGVSDGAYLIGKNIKEFSLERDISYNRAVYLLKSIELGTNKAYLESKINETEIGKRILKMSVLTKHVLQGVNYDLVAEKRKRNFEYLHDRFNDIQLLKIPDGDKVPYVYPLMLNQGIHEKLVQHKVYVPILWNHIININEKDSFEYRYASKIMALPIDQRYDIKDLEYLLSLVLKIIKNNN